MPAVLFFAVTWAGLPPEQALERALDAAEPAPALRAAFHATLTSGNAVRRIEYDPYLDTGPQFRVTLSHGDNEELDEVVKGWMAEPDPDSRLFADDLRLSIGDARIAGAPELMTVSFRHKMSNNDGAFDAPFSAHMSGRLQLDQQSGYVRKIDYTIDRPVTLEDGTRVDEYRQSYNFAYSERWGVSYVMSYELFARGGRWGLSEERTVKVQLTDVAFGFAGDSDQELEVRPSQSVTGLTAILR